MKTKIWHVLNKLIWGQIDALRDKEGEVSSVSL